MKKFLTSFLTAVSGGLVGGVLAVGLVSEGDSPTVTRKPYVSNVSEENISTANSSAGAMGKNKTNPSQNRTRKVEDSRVTVSDGKLFLERERTIESPIEHAGAGIAVAIPADPKEYILAIPLTDNSELQSVGDPTLSP